jgi:hypothetical protein
MERKSVWIARKAISICMFMFLALPVIAQSRQDQLYGTWVTSFGGYHFYKIEITAEHMIDYMKGSDAPFAEAHYTIDKEWTDDQGHVLFQCTTRWSWIPFNDSKVWGTTFFLFQIDDSGNKMREVHSDARMPADVHSGIVSDRQKQ